MTNAAKMTKTNHTAAVKVRSLFLSSLPLLIHSLGTRLVSLDSSSTRHRWRFFRSNHSFLEYNHFSSTKFPHHSLPSNFPRLQSPFQRITLLPWNSRSSTLHLVLSFPRKNYRYPPSSRNENFTFLFIS